MTPIGEFKENDDSKSVGMYLPSFTAEKAKILVVDDNSMNLSVLKGLLKSTKVQVETAESGYACLDLLKDNSYDLLLLDHMMPGMDGIETLEKVREINKTIPAVALTANYMANGDEFYGSKGFCGYISKPIDSAALEEIIIKNLPEELVTKLETQPVYEDASKLPSDMEWLEDLDDIDVASGIKNCGGVTGYIFSVQLFLDTIDENAKVIENAYAEEDIKLYTIKVHALKSSSKIIGANNLSELAREMEDAGNRGDIAFISSHHNELLAMYRSFKQKLSRMNSHESADDTSKESISSEDLKNAYEALKETAEQMDYDSAELILSQLDKYDLPSADNETFAEISKALKAFDWDKVDELLSSH
jgi:CheY-like chemotaxis protein